MKTTTCFAVAMFAITINCLASGSNAQPMSSSSSTHSGSCAGGCNHGSSSDSIELIPYGQAGYTAMRRSFPSQQMSSYGRSDMMSDRSGYVPQFLNSTPYRANQRPDYQGSPSMQYDRRGRQNYDTRRENFTYANETDSGYSYRGNRMPGGCPGGCSHDGRRDSYDSQRYERGGQSGLERGSQYRNEADRVPQLGMYPPVRRQQSAAYYGQTPSKRLLQMRQEYGSPQTQGGVGMSSQEAFSLMDALKAVGVVSVEFFYRGGEILVNEIAPRTHNSGHLTIEGHATSQFEQHVRAICGLALGSTQQTKPAAMANILGNQWKNGDPHWHLALTIPNVKLHLYGKGLPEPNRKMGHLTATANSPEEASKQVKSARQLLTSDCSSSDGAKQCQTQESNDAC